MRSAWFLPKRLPASRPCKNRARRAERGEVRRELLAPLLRVARRLVILARTPLGRDSARKEWMSRRLDEVAIVDHQRLLHHARRDGLADQPPRNGVKVLAIHHKAFGVDGAVHDLGGGVGRFRQWNQAGKLLGVTVDRPRLGLAVNPHVGDLAQPPRRRLVQMLQIAKRAST